MTASDWDSTLDGTDFVELLESILSRLDSETELKVLEILEIASSDKELVPDSEETKSKLEDADSELEVDETISELEDIISDELDDSILEELEEGSSEVELEETNSEELEETGSEELDVKLSELIDDITLEPEVLDDTTLELEVGGQSFLLNNRGSCSFDVKSLFFIESFKVNCGQFPGNFALALSSNAS